MPKFDIESYFEKARNHLSALTHGHENMWNIGSADRWDADLNNRIIKWTFSDGRIVKAPVQIIGTYNTIDNTFLWGWDHPSVDEDLSKDAKNVLKFAEINNIDILKSRKVECSEEAAWDLTALATLINNRQGAYRGPSGDTLVFMTFGEVSISKQP